MGNLGLGCRAAVENRVGQFLTGLSVRNVEVRPRCRTVLQSRAKTLRRKSSLAPSCQMHIHHYGNLMQGQTSGRDPLYASPTLPAYPVLRHLRPSHW